jgi:hypothetical protein
MKRQCGSCTLCCTVMGVPSISKDRDERCTYMRQGRCSVYAQRPGECREFNCLWLMGLLPNELRPDKVKAVGNANAAGDILIFHIHPSSRGAHKKEPLAGFIANAERKGVSIIVCCEDDRHLYGPVKAAALTKHKEWLVDGSLVQIEPRRDK